MPKMISAKLAALGIAALTFAVVALGQGPAAQPFVTHQLKPNIYYIEGGGGHSGVIVGDGTVAPFQFASQNRGGLTRGVHTKIEDNVPMPDETFTKPKDSGREDKGL